jgi:hypothetical protein
VTRPALLAALLIAAACGTASTPSADGAGLLSASAVPGVPYTTTVLTVVELSRDASVPDLGSKISALGYVQGAERTFQGESKHLTFVVSRSLTFQDAAGATAYVALVHDNATAYFGVAGVQPLVAQGRQGWQFTPSACACHLANPVVVGAVSSGPDVSWLEINGPDATPSLLLSLFDPSNSVPATPS